MSDPPHVKVHADRQLTVNVHDRQLTVLHEINQLNCPRPGIVEMLIDVRLLSMSSDPSFMKHNICSVISCHKHSKCLIYFGPHYTPDESGRVQLLSDLTRSALVGCDHILSSGKGRSKGQSLYIRCQCVGICRESKFDKINGHIIGRSDYCPITSSNTVKQSA
jgi:hypothetical protein